MVSCYGSMLWGPEVGAKDSGLCPPATFAIGGIDASVFVITFCTTHI